MIGIICAMDVELKSVQAALRDAREEEAYGFRYYSGKIGSRDVVMVRCGIGKVNAAVCCQTMILRYQPECIINTGVAGSLSKSVNLLDIVIATSAVEHDMDTSPIGDPVGFISGINIIQIPCDEKIAQNLLRAANSIGGIHAVTGCIASGDQFVTDGQRKAWIVESFHADAVEMEGAAIAHTCYLSNTPCVVLRSISDSTDDQHQMEFAEFAAVAAKNAARVLTAYITSLN